MDPIVLAFGTALVAAAATDSWQQVHDAVVRVWHRARLRRQAGAIEGSEGDIGRELTVLREKVLQARRNDDAAAEKAFEGAWQVRTDQLLQANPPLTDELKNELKEVLERVLKPALAPAEQARIGTIIMNANSYGCSTITQIGQFNTKSTS